MPQLQPEVVLGWGCELTQPPTEAVQGPWPDLLPQVLACHMLRAVKAGELALAGSHTSAQLLHPPADRRENRRRKSKETHRLEYSWGNHLPSTVGG